MRRTNQSIWRVWIGLSCRCGGEERPVVLEVFTDSADERDVLEMLYTLEDSVEGRMKQAAKEMLGRKGIGIVKKIIGR